MERLQKYISDCGVMSRRAAENEIINGRVTVNGNVAVIGQRVEPGVDKVELNGVPVVKRDDERVYVILNKPRGYVTTLSDEKGRDCIAELISDVGVRLYPVGRLDYNSEGLLICTNDGQLTNVLTHPKHSIPKIYNVKLNSEITDEQLETLNSPLEIDGYLIMPVKTEILYKRGGASLLKMTLFEGRNRQIRKMCDIAGVEIVSLRRIAVGKIVLGSLEYGKWRYMTREEIDYLKQATQNNL